MNNITIASSSDLYYLSNANTIFEVVADIGLGGNLYVLDKSSILRFNGGRFYNGTLGGYINLQALSNNIFCPTTLAFASGTVMNVPWLRPEWFGAKADYNPSTHAGTDDYVSINRTISVAEQLSIKIVKFGAANYFITSAIEINYGNVWLEGSGALLREEEYNEGVLPSIPNTTSTIFCHTVPGLSCIVCKENVANPIYIKDLQLICNLSEGETYQQDACAYGIHFKSKFWGPTWPVIIERCHFHNFLYAFYIDNPHRRYPIHALKFKDCSFSHNRYCVYSGAIGNERLRSWSFEFIDNKCHFNSYILHIAVHKGACIIENNNTESTFGLTTEEDVPTTQAEEYAIDVVLGERACAIIQYNHFERNNTPLVKITGQLGPTWSTVKHNNIDSVEGDNLKCLFVNTNLNTDMPGLVDQCIIDSRNLKGRDLVFPVEGCNFALFRHNANCLLSENYLRNIVNTNIANETSFPKVFLDTPMGKKCMTQFHSEPLIGSNTERYHCLTNLTIATMAQDKYVNYETLYYVQSDKNHLTCSACIVIYYLDANGNPVIGNDGPLYTLGWKDFWAFETGFFRLRGCAKLLQNVTYHSISVELRVYTNDNYIEPTGAVYFGSRIIVLSEDPIPTNMLLSPDLDMQITGLAGDCYMLKKNDRFVSGCFNVTCLSDGNHIAIPNMSVLSGNELLSDPIPIGSIWKSGYTSFKITGLAGDTLVSGMYTYYYEIISGPSLSVISNLQNVEPTLLGNGCGQNGDMSLPIVSKLCAGSTFYDVSNNVYYILNSNHQWVTH